MKGIILAGGKGTRLYPNTLVTSKQLLPVYDKPMIYYPLATLMEAYIKDILLISDPNNIDRYKSLLGCGSHFGVKMSYVVQPEPNGLAEAFILGEDFIGEDQAALILGDNLFYGVQGAVEDVVYYTDLGEEEARATIFLYEVSDPSRYGVAELDKNYIVTNIVEKPENPKSNWAVTGLYIYPSGVSQMAKKLSPSARGELEITDLNNLYREDGRLWGHTLHRGVAWLDTGTPRSMMEAGNFIQAIQDRTGKQVGCLEEIAWRNGWISRDDVIVTASGYYKNSDYGDYLWKLAEKGIDW